MKFVTFLLPLAFLCIVASAQTGILTGSIKDGDNNNPLVGATLTIKGAKPAITNNEGVYKITGLRSGTYTLSITFVGYDAKEIDEVVIKAGEITTQDISLALSKKNTLENVVVKTSARRETLAAVLNTRRNMSVTSDIISADMIRKSPDKSTSDVLKRVSGTTVQDNKFVLVRGMNDRYNEAMLNGALLPSSEPDRKTFAFDIFPAEIVDNITVIKSATPELPGSFSGGLIQINTKDVPDKNFIYVKGGLTYNSVTTGKDFAHYKGGSSDWLGTDDGTRALPASFPSSEKYSTISIQKQVELAKGLPNNWAVLNRNAPLTNALQVSGGFSTKPADINKQYPVFGAIFNLTHNQTFKNIDYSRYDYSQNVVDSFYRLTDKASSTAILSSVLANFSLRTSQYTKFFFNNIYSTNSTDLTVLRSGPVQANGWTDVRANAFFFTSNKIYNTQIGGTHYLQKARLHIKWLGYYTSLNRSEPDYRRNIYFQNEVDGPYVAVVTAATTANTTGAGVHYYADVKDKSAGATVDFAYDFSVNKLPQAFKFGAGYYHNTRSRDARFFSAGVANSDNFNGNLYYYGQDSIFSPKNYNAKTGFTLFENYDAKNHYDGSITNLSGYLMMDNKLARAVRLVWGLRFESYNNIINTFNPSNQAVKIDTTYNDLMPSVNFIYSVLPKANLRFAYSNTVARPQYRELANQLFYDFLTNTTFFGNPYLVETRVNNYEVRWEHYFPAEQYYSISGFYKRFKNPIEPYIAISGADSRTVGFQNVPTADNFGLELEARKNFDFIGKDFENLYFYFNVSLINSKTSAHTSKEDSTFRPLQGQSPYIANISLQYNDPKTNLGVSLLYNVIGPRLYLVGGLDQDPIWEKIHSTLDFKVIKSFYKNKGSVEFTFSDILHKNDYQYWDLNKSSAHNYSNGDALIQLAKYGYNVSLALSYRLQ